MHHEVPALGSVWRNMSAGKLVQDDGALWTSDDEDDGSDSVSLGSNSDDDAAKAAKAAVGSEYKFSVRSGTPVPAVTGPPFQCVMP